MDIQYFAVQHWRQEDHVAAKRLPGTNNSADSMTKPTPYDLFMPHMYYAMGVLRRSVDPKSLDFGEDHRYMVTQEAEEGVRANTVAAPQESSQSREGALTWSHKPEAAKRATSVQARDMRATGK